MKPPSFDYHAPGSLDEALSTLAQIGDEGKVLAGGQSLVPLLNMRLASPAALVDIARLDALDTIDVDGEVVRVGARVRQSRLLGHDGAAAAQPLLRRALTWVAHPVIRNRGTVVGSIVHADPAGEMPAVVALLDATVELASTVGSRMVPAADFFLGPLESDTRPDELAVAVTFPRLPPRTGTAFTELARRHGDYAVAGVGVTVTLDEDRQVASARAALFGVGPVPVTFGLTDHLAGQPHDALRTSDAVASVRGAVHPSGDIHASGDYRRHLAGVLLHRALSAAAADAGEESS